MKHAWESIRSAMAIMLVATVCVGFLLKMVSSDAFLALTGTAMTFYFAGKKRPEPTGNGESNGGKPEAPKVG